MLPRAGNNGDTAESRKDEQLSEEWIRTKISRLEIQTTSPSSWGSPLHVACGIQIITKIYIQAPLVQFCHPIAHCLPTHGGRMVGLLSVFATRINRMKVKEQGELICKYLAFPFLSQSTMINHSECRPDSKWITKCFTVQVIEREHPGIQLQREQLFFQYFYPFSFPLKFQ